MKISLPLKDKKYFTFGFRNILSEQNLYKPENVINGFSRPYGLPNVWVSKDENNPWLQLDFDSPKNIKEIQIIFNGQLESNNFSSPIRQLIKDYSIEVFKDDGTIERIQVRDNYMALNKHAVNIENAAKIKFTFEETYGARFFEVFAVKVF